VTYSGDSNFLASSGTSAIPISPGPATHFTVSAPQTAPARTAFSFTVTALDQFNSTAAGYTGTVHFTSTDGQATLPANYTFTAADASVHTFTNGATLRTTSAQTITASDTNNTSITGTSGTITVSVTNGTITLLASCPAGGNWSNPACWSLNRAPATGDDVIIGGSGQPNTTYDLGGAVQLHSLTIQNSGAANAVTGGPIGLLGGGSITDNNSGSDILPNWNFAGVATIACSLTNGTLSVGAITGTAGFTKTGPGTLVLSGNNTLSGTVTVSGGTLYITGSLPNGSVTVGSGATLTGTGTVSSISVQSGGTLTGTLTATAGTTFAAGSTFSVVLTNSTTFSQLFGGTVNLTAGPTLNVVMAGGFTPSSGSTFAVIPGAITGTFNGLANGTTFNVGGIFFRINYGSVLLTPLAATIPALSRWGLALAAILLALLASWTLRLRRETEAR
jgi:autotransporter-associated beta strand protein